MAICFGTWATRGVILRFGPIIGMGLVLGIFLFLRRVRSHHYTGRWSPPGRLQGRHFRETGRLDSFFVKMPRFPNSPGGDHGDQNRRPGDPPHESWQLKRCGYWTCGKLSLGISEPWRCDFGRAILRFRSKQNNVRPCSRHLSPKWGVLSAVNRYHFVGVYSTSTSLSSQQPVFKNKYAQQK